MRKTLYKLNVLDCGLMILYAIKIAYTYKNLIDTFIASLAIIIHLYTFICYLTTYNKVRTNELLIPSLLYRLMNITRYVTLLFIALFIVVMIIDINKDEFTYFDFIYVINILYTSYAYRCFKNYYIFLTETTYVYHASDNEILLQNQQQLDNTYEYQVNEISNIIIEKRQAITEGTNECSICLQKIQVNESYTILFCQHEYHYDCISAWIMKNATCPLCNHTIS